VSIESGLTLAQIAEDHQLDATQLAALAATALILLVDTAASDDVGGGRVVTPQDLAEAIATIADLASSADLAALATAAAAYADAGDSTTASAAAGALATHASDTTGVHGVADTAELATRDKLVEVEGAEGAVELDLAGGTVFLVTPAGDTSISLLPYGELTLQQLTLIWNGDGAADLSLADEVHWAGGDLPDLTDLTYCSVITLLSKDGGATWLGFVAGLNMVAPAP
jgi:hypothetical protein